MLNVSGFMARRVFIYLIYIYLFIKVTYSRYYDTTGTAQILTLNLTLKNLGAMIPYPMHSGSLHTQTSANIHSKTSL